MARFGEINAQYFDDAGDPLGSGKIYFYETGTTTLKDTYSDINQTIANTNPVILSAAGRQPNIFFSGTAKAILTDKNDVQILVRDPIGQTASVFGDAWVATKIYGADAVVLGSDGQYYRSLAAGNQNNNPTSTSGYWTLLYSVEWNSGVTYQEGAVVTYNGEQYQSLQNSNLNNNPSSATTYWVLLSFAWLSTRTYAINENAVGTDGILYTSLQNSNTGNIPASSPAYWVGTSAAAAASATAAAASATAAAASETAAATSETNAAASETAAAASETAAATSATSASTSATNAATSATNAATSETNAATSATAAASSASAASTSETNAAASASAASTSETNAAASETAAAASETAAATSETNAATSATSASTSATNAATSETNAATSATSASTSATNAATSATAAAGSATSAATSATDAANTYDLFDDRFLGEKTSDPTTDNDGNPLVTGAIYFNSVTNNMKVYNGTAWQNVAPTATSITLSQVSDVTATAAEVNLLDALSRGSILYGNSSGATAVLTKGTANQVLTSDGTDISWADVVAGGPTITATATGALANGDTVILNSDGTVSAIEAATSSAVQFESGSAQYNNVVYDSTNAKIVIVYRDASNSNYGTAVVGTVSGTSISFGTPVVYKSGGTGYNSADYDSTNSKIVIAYYDTSNGDGAAVVGTVSGTSISFGTETVFLTPNLAQYTATTFDSNAGKVLISYQDFDAQEGQSIVGTVSGTSISFGTAATFESARAYGVLSAFDSSANKILIIYRDQLNSFYATAVVATISGTSVSFGTPVVFDSNNSPTLGITFDSNVNKFLVSYKNGSDNLGYAAVGTISGTSVSFGTASAYTSGVINDADQRNLTFDSNLNKCVLFYNSTDNSSYPAFRTATISGTSVSFGTVVLSQSDSSGTYLGVGFDSTQNRVVGAFRNSTGVEGRSYVYDASVTAILGAENFVGISDGAYADAATATIQVVGNVDDAQTGLTAGVKYYVEKDGSLGTDSNQPYAGLGVSSTEILIKG